GVGRKTEVARRERKRQPDDYFAGRDIEHRKAAAFAASDHDLISIPMEADDRRFIAGIDPAVDSAGSERSQWDALSQAADARGAASPAEIELVGRRGEANAAFGAQRIERQFNY